LIRNKFIEFRVKDLLKLLITGLGELHVLEEMIFIEYVHTKVCVDLQLLLILIQDYLHVLGFRILDSDEVKREVKFVTGQVRHLRACLCGCRI
jgi:hypothetical protein